MIYNFTNREIIDMYMCIQTTILDLEERQEIFNENLFEIALLKRLQELDKKITIIFKAENKKLKMGEKK